MRVHLGSDHAGLDLKDHLVSWLRERGHEPVDHGPFVYDALDDYPVFCLRAAEGVVADPGSLGVVIGGSGNGEQIAANKVAGVRCGPGVERRDGVARPPAQRRQRALRRRPDAQPRGDDPLRRHLPRHRLHRRGTPRPPHRDAHRLRVDRRPAAAARRPRSATMPEGHTLRRLADDLDAAFAGTPRAGEQSAGPVRRGRRRWSTARSLVGADSAGKHLFVEFAGRSLHPRAPRPDRQVRPASGAGAAAASGRCGCGCRTRRRTPTSAARPSAT